MSAHDNYLDPDRHLWSEEPPEWYMEGQKVVFDFFSCEEGWTEKECMEWCERAAYKYTDCGAWIEFTETGIVLGSIVEGLDFGTMTYPLSYDGITSEMIQERIDAVEKEADALWEWGNVVHDGDEETWAEQGIDAPDVGFEYRHLGQGERSS